MSGKRRRLTFYGFPRNACNMLRPANILAISKPRLALEQPLLIVPMSGPVTAACSAGTYLFFRLRLGRLTAGCSKAREVSLANLLCRSAGKRTIHKLGTASEIQIGNSRS